MGQDESLPVLDENQRYIDFSNESLTHLNNFIPENHPVESINLTGNKIRQFPLILHNLKFLDISQNELYEIDFSNYKFNFDSLQNIRMASNKLKSIPISLFNIKTLANISLESNDLSEETCSFSDFPKLKNLDLFLNLFSTIPSLPESLVSLNIGFNQIRSISYHAENLTELSLPGNEMSEFSSDCFFSNLTTLDLSMNRLVALPPIISIAPKLQKLNCSHNFMGGIASIPSSLVYLDISHNCLESITFTNLDNLQILDLSFNKLKYLAKLPNSIIRFNAEHNLINKSAPLALKSLNVLQINSNLFTEIPSFKDSVVNVFIMRNNKIASINVDNFNNLVQRIDLTDNDIEEIPTQLFEIRKIQSLNISFNRVKEIPPLIAGLNITTLFINDNPISDLPELPQSLLCLNASGCNFKSIPESVYNIPRLSSIDFSHNMISSIESLPNVNQINLSMNLIVKLPSIPEKVTAIDLSNNKLKSFEFGGDLNMIQDINLSNNQLSTLTISCPKLSVLHTFKISNNNKLKFNLQYELFPALRVIDITFTKVKVILPFPDKFKEISTSDQDFFVKASSPVVRFYNSDKAGYSEICGNRKSMEDTLIVRKDIGKDLDMYAVIDGHAGAETATLAAYYIPIEFSLSPNKSISAISQVFRKVNLKVSENNVKDGATIALALISPKEIGIAHLGDTRALIVLKDGRVYSMTVDHKPTERSEIDMIKEKKSFVNSSRTAGILAVSRSLGDLHINGVVRVPDMSCHVRSENDYRLVICCDGVFDVLENYEVAKLVCQVEDVNDAACLVRNTAFSKGSQDNISVIVVDITLKKK